MKKFLFKLIFYKFLSAFSLVFIIAGSGVSQRGTLTAYYAKCPVCGKKCHHSQFCDGKGKNVVGGTIHINSPEYIVQQQHAAEEAKKQEEKCRQEEEERLRKIEEEKKARKAAEEKLRQEKEKEELEAREKERKYQEEREARKRKIEEEMEQYVKWKKEGEEEKRVRQKQQNNEGLTREEDEKFNGGMERSKEIEHYLEKLTKDGKTEELRALEELRNRPDALSYSDLANLYLSFNRENRLPLECCFSQDLVDKSIVISVNNSAEMLGKLNYNFNFRNQSLIENLSSSIAFGENSLVQQANFLSSQNNVEGALNTTSLINNIAGLVNDFASGVYDRGMQVGGAIVGAGAKVLETVTHMVTHPQEVIEKIGLLSLEAEYPEMTQTMAQLDPSFAAKREEMKADVSQKYDSLKNTAEFVGEVGKELLTFGTEYAPAFYSSEDYDYVSGQERVEMFKQQQECQQKLRDAVTTYASHVTAKGVGHAAGEMLVDTVVMMGAGKALGAVGKAMGLTGEAEGAYAAAREVNAAHELGAATVSQETNGINKVIEEAYKQTHHGLTPHEVQAFARQKAIQEAAEAAQLAESSAPLENAASSAAKNAPLYADEIRECELRHIAYERKKQAAEHAARIKAQSEVSPGIVDDRPQLAVDDRSSKIATSKAQSEAKRNSFVCKESNERIFLLDQCSAEIAAECKELYAMLPPHLQNKSVIDQFMNLKKKFPDISPKSYTHIFYGEFHLPKKAGMPVVKLKGGMHTEEGFQQFLKANKEFVKNCPVEIIECEKGIQIVLVPEEMFFDPTKYGKSVAVINGKKYEGVKTLWPKHYTPERIWEESKKIISNTKNLVEPGKYCGKTSDGFFANVYVDFKNLIKTSHPKV